MDPDWSIRLAAFERLKVLQRSHGDVLPWSAIEDGFEHQGNQYRLANVPKGIFRPKGMIGGALSIKTTVPVSGEPKYRDLQSDGGFSYAFQGSNPDHHDNLLLRKAAELNAPLINFFGITKGLYSPVWPVYIADLDLGTLRATVVTSSEQILEPGEHIADALGQQLERRYATRLVRQRLHQRAFRELVLDAYDTRCGVCGLPRRELMDAAHICPDRDVLGEPRVPNGLALCKLHHSAFDADLLGISPRGVIELGPRLLKSHDGPTLEYALKGFHGQSIRLPRRGADRPAPELLEARYERFRAVGAG